MLRVLCTSCTDEPKELSFAVFSGACAPQIWSLSVLLVLTAVEFWVSIAAISSTLSAKKSGVSESLLQPFDGPLCCYTPCCDAENLHTMARVVGEVEPGVLQHAPHTRTPATPRP
jgi:hypothetical protein